MNEKEMIEKIKNDAEKIEVPESLSPENMREKLSERPMEFSGKRKRGVMKYLIPIAAAAAAFAVVMVAVGPTLFQKSNANSNGQSNTAAGVASVAKNQATPASESKTFTRSDAGTAYRVAKSDNEIKEYIKKLDEERAGDLKYTGGLAIAENADSNVSGAPIAAAGSASAASSHSDTNLMEEGVDESDIVKCDNAHIYRGSDDKVHIVNVEAPDMKELSVIDLSNEKEEAYVNELYLQRRGCRRRTAICCRERERRRLAGNEVRIAGHGIGLEVRKRNGCNLDRLYGRGDVIRGIFLHSRIDARLDADIPCAFPSLERNVNRQIPLNAAISLNHALERRRRNNANVVLVGNRNERNPLRHSAVERRVARVANNPAQIKRLARGHHVRNINRINMKVGIRAPVLCGHRNILADVRERTVPAIKHPSGTRTNGWCRRILAKHDVLEQIAAPATNTISAKLELNRPKIRVGFNLKRNLLRRAISIRIRHKHGEGICSWSCGNTGKRTVSRKSKTARHILRYKADVVIIGERRSNQVDIAEVNAITGGHANKCARGVSAAVGAEDSSVGIKRDGGIDRRSPAVVAGIVPEESDGVAAICRDTDAGRTSAKILPERSNHHTIGKW